MWLCKNIPCDNSSCMWPMGFIKPAPVAAETRTPGCGCGFPWKTPGLPVLNPMWHVQVPGYLLLFLISKSDSKQMDSVLTMNKIWNHLMIYLRYIWLMTFVNHLSYQRQSLTVQSTSILSPFLFDLISMSFNLSLSWFFSLLFSSGNLLLLDQLWSKLLQGPVVIYGPFHVYYWS